MTDPVYLHTSFEHYWRRYLEAATTGDGETARRMMDEIKRLRVERNARDLRDIGLSLVYQGFAHVESGSLVDARTFFEIARDVAPGLSTTYWGLARVAQEEGGLGYLSSIAYRAQGQMAALRSTSTGPYASWNLIFLAFTTLVALVFAFGIVMLYRYAALLYHDLEERFGDRQGSMALLAMTLAALSLPLIVTAGIGWLASYWLVLTFAYQSAKERLVTVLALLLLLAAAPFAELYAAWTRTVANPVYQAALSSVSGTFDVGDVEILRRAAMEYPGDRDLQFLLAVQYKNLGDYELAARQYRRILDAFPDDLEARLNLGNIYFAQRDWDGALVQYNDAIAANSRFALAHYNKSLAHAEKFQFAEREEARARADALDASAIVAHEQFTGSYRGVADARLDEMEILGKFYGLSSGLHEEPVTSFLDPARLEGWGLRFVAVPIVLAILLVGLELSFKERRLTQKCWKCGSAFCGRCQIGTGRKGLCTQCYHLFFMRDGVSAQARNEKLRLVERASAKRSLVFRLFSVILPGAGHISEGMPLAGSLLLLLWLSGLCAILFGGKVYAFPDGVLGWGSGVSLVSVLAMVVALVAANVLSRPVVRN